MPRSTPPVSFLPGQAGSATPLPPTGWYGFRFPLVRRHRTHNGAGKTTTMRVILGLDAPTSGRALVAGRRYDGLIRPLREVGRPRDRAAGRGRTGRLRLVLPSPGDPGPPSPGRVPGPPGVPGAVLAAGLMLGLGSLLGLALGAIVRHTAGGIAATIPVIVVPSILGLLPAPWNGRIGRFTLLDAAGQVTALHPAAGLFSPGVPAGPAGLAGRRPGGGRGPHHPPGRLRPARRWTLRHWKLGRWPRPRPPARSA